MLLDEVMGQHVIAQEMRPQDWKSGVYPSLMPGVNVRFSGDVNGASIGSDIGFEAEVDVSSEILVTNGVIFVTDDVVVPPFTLWAHIRNLGFEMFVIAVEATEPVDRFTDIRSTMTVFPPTNDAFVASGWDATRMTRNNERASVEAIIDGHVIDDEISMSKLFEQARATSDGELVKAQAISGQAPIVTRPESGVEGTVTQADFRTDYGYIHAVDTVLPVP